MNRELIARCARGSKAMTVLALGMFALAACDHKEAAPTCGTTDTPPCSLGTGGAPHDSGGGVEQQK